MSHNYPATKPPAPAGGYPWKAFNFKTQPEQYIRAVLNYARQDLDPVGWDAAAAASPKWFHAPWMSFGPESGVGREFIHGMTRERTVAARLLNPTATSGSYSSYAVGYYNGVGGWTFGKVWSESPANPDIDEAKFSDGAVSVKLLFTSATSADLPFLANTMQWQTNVWDSAAGERVPEMFQLLQVDVAVRETRNSSLTGWVFGTFVYNSSLPGATPMDRLTPVGIMWGNNPTIRPGSTSPLTQTWINPNTGTFQHLGYGGRLNGPIDNPISSCLSCHATAQTPARSGMTYPNGATTTQQMRWFRNIKAGKLFDNVSNTRSLDYSLQMLKGVQNATTWRNANTGANMAMEARPEEFPAAR